MPGFPTGPPIVYLPGVSRSELRAADTCPPELAPIAELQYRSQWFSHPNNRDWTVRALLTNRERGLGLRIADDADTSDGAAPRARPAARRAGRSPCEAGARRRLTSTSSSTRIQSAASCGGSTTRMASSARLDSTRVDRVRPAVQGGLRVRPGYRRRDHRRPEARRARRASGRTSGGASRRRHERYPGIADQLRQGPP